MNEEALKDAYALFAKGGYNGNIDQFKTLISTNGNALKDAHSLFSKGGYTGDINHFKTLMGVSGAKEPVKKKDSTASASKLAQPTSGSSSKEVKTDYDGKPLKPKAADYSKYQKVGDTYYEGQGEIFTNYPGNEGRAYRFNDGQWFEYSSSLAVGGAYDKPVEQLKKPIKDPLRINALNKQYGKQGSTEKGVFIGYPGKEQNEYKFEGGQWKRRTPESNTWVTVTNEGSINALNNQFKKEAKPIAVEQEAKLKKDNQYSVDFQKNLNSINSSLIDKESDEAVKILRQTFPSSNGWRFEQSGPTDRVQVTAPNGQKEVFILDNWTWDDDKSEAVRMKKWMDSNNLTYTERELDMQAKQKFKEEARFERSTTLGDREAMEAQKVIMEKNLSDALGIEKKLSAEDKRLLELSGKAQEEATAVRGEWLNQKMRKAADIQSKYQEYLMDPSGMTENEKETAQAALGALAEDKQVMYQVNQYQDDIKNNSLSYKKKYEETEVYLQDVAQKYQNGEITKEQFNSEVNAKQKELNDQYGEIKNQIKLSDNLTKSANIAAAENAVIQATQGSLGGGLVLSGIKGALSPLRLLNGAIGESMTAEEWHNAITESISPFWDFNTSLEYLRSEERSDLYKASFSVAESLGAMAATGGIGLTGSIARGLASKGASQLVSQGVAGAVSFYPMSYYEMKDELEGIDMPESHKIAMSSIYGVVSSALESLGMEYAMGKVSNAGLSAIKRNVLKNFLSKPIAKDAPKEFIEAAIRAEAKTYLASLAAGTVGAGAVEGITEATQSLVGAGIKEIYDQIGNKTELFSNEGLGNIVKGALYEGYLGALGGGMVHSVYVAKDAYTRNRALNSKELGLLMLAAKTNGMSETLMANLKADMLSGRMTSKQANEIVQNFDMVRGNMNQMPENLTPEAQSVSLSLMMERDRLNKQIEGKDPNLVKPQSERVAEINNRLQEIAKENAIQEQSTGEVPVQPTTGVGQQMEERVPESKTERTTGEGVREEAQAEQAQAEVTEEEGNVVEQAIPTAQPTERFEFTEENLPQELQGVEPIGRTEIGRRGILGIGTRGPKTTTLTFSGQQMIDAGLRAEQPQAQPVTEEAVVVEEAPQAMPMPQASVPTRADVTALNKGTLAPERVDSILMGAIEAQEQGKALNKTQQRIFDENQGRVEELVSSRTLSDEVTALSSLIEGTTQTPAFQMAQEDKGSKESVKERKTQLEEKATTLMERIQPEITEEVFESSEPTKGYTSVDVKENLELTQDVPKKSLREYVGKKMNLLMADLLKVDLSGKVKKMGGAFFPLIPGLRGKVAWASIDLDAAKKIVRGAMNSDISMVYNMNPEAFFSNKTFLNSVMNKISELSDANDIFSEMMNYLQTVKFAGKTDEVHKIARESKSMEEFADNFYKLDVDTKADIMKKILPEETIEPETKIGQMLKKDGITKEAMIAENVEQFAADLPAGALTMALNIVDENGNRPTPDTIDNFIIDRDQAKAMGLPIHENYPFYIKGNVDAILTETASFWDVLKDFKRSVDAKIANLIQKKDTYTVEVVEKNKEGKKVKKEIAVKVYNNPNGTRTVEVFKDTKAKGEGTKTITSQRTLER
jgi:hypothetical protein